MTVLAWIGGILAFVVLVFGITFAAWGTQWLTAPIRGSLDAREQIQADGNFRIQAYQGFFNQCASIQALEGEMDAQREFIKTASVVNDRAIAEANVAAIQGARSGAIFRYNQDAQKNWTEGQFRSNKLPFQIPTSSYGGENKTVCAL